MLVPNLEPVGIQVVFLYCLTVQEVDHCLKSGLCHRLLGNKTQERSTEELNTAQEGYLLAPCKIFHIGSGVSKVGPNGG